MSTDCSCVVLYADDSDDDAFLMRRAFSKVNFPGELVVVSDGEAAIKYLEGDGRAADRGHHRPPCLVLLDIKMPRIGGLEVLKWIRSHAEFDQTPVLMLTSSSQKSDIATAYELKADAYLVKPADLDLFRELVEDLTKLCDASGRAVIKGAIRCAVPAPG